MTASKFPVAPSAARASPSPPSAWAAWACPIFYGPSEEATNLAVLNHAIDIGVNFLDTADMYGVGANERLLAQVLKSRRDEIVLATKFGNVRAPNGDFLGVSGTPAYVAAACDASLQRLGVDHIDLYYQHRVDPKCRSRTPSARCSAWSKPAKVRHLGMSEASAATLRRARPVHPIAAPAKRILAVDARCGGGNPADLPRAGHRLRALQPTRSRLPYRRDPAHRRLAASDWRRSNPRFQDGNVEHNRALVEALTRLAHARVVRLRSSPWRGCWRRDRTSCRSRAPGACRAWTRTRSGRHRVERCGAAKHRGGLVEHTVAGTRYPEAHMAAVNL
jgi:aryl-alcohol dehydrogenase-like predicted oxidoreductase